MRALVTCCTALTGCPFKSYESQKIQSASCFFREGGFFFCHVFLFFLSFFQQLFFSFFLLIFFVDFFFEFFFDENIFQKHFFSNFFLIFFPFLLFTDSNLNNFGTLNCDHCFRTQHQNRYNEYTRTETSRRTGVRRYTGSDSTCWPWAKMCGAQMALRFWALQLEAIIEWFSIGRGEQTVGSRLLGARRAVRMANLGTVRRTPLPSFVEDGATKSVSSVRRWTRCWHDEGHGWHSRRRPATRDCTQTRFAPNEVGKTGDPVCGKDGPGCLLGVVGRCAPHDLCQVAWFGVADSIVENLVSGLVDRGAWQNCKARRTV